MRKSPNRRVNSIAERRMARQDSGGPARRSDMLSDWQMARSTKARRRTLMLYMVAFARNQAEPHHAIPTPSCTAVTRPATGDPQKRGRNARYPRPACRAWDRIVHSTYPGTYEDSPMTTPASSVPASQLARSARSEDVVAKHKKYLWPSVTNYFQQPLVADRGEMQYIWDLDGNKYLDFFGGILTVSVGHCNPKIANKVNAQVNRLQHTSTLYPNEHIVALAEKIAQITPGNLQQSFFTNSGTEANEAAILLARMATGSYDVVALRHAYSGGSALAKSVTAHAPYRKGGVISVGISHAVNPYCYRCPLHLKYPDCEVACADDVENLIQTGTSGNI